MLKVIVTDHAGHRLRERLAVIAKQRDEWQKLAIRGGQDD